jgi:phosphate transport system substrate-binding protein
VARYLIERITVTITSLRRATPLVGVATLALVLAACGGGDDTDTDAGTESTGDAGTDEGTGGALSGSINVDGSSTVFPLTQAAAELFNQENPDVRISVAFSGTGGGFEKFCRGETDMSNASRPIKDEEAAICEENGIAYDEFGIANDALTVVVNPENDWVECLTVEELNTIWAPEADGVITSWAQVRDGFPDEPLDLYGPGTDSGTFDYFTEEINGESQASRTDFQPSEDDNQIVAGVVGSTSALGYFGFSYYEENIDAVKGIAIDGGDGCVAPSAEAVIDGTYTPLGRQLFIYPSQESLERPEMEAFVSYYIENNDAIVEAAAFVPLSDDQKVELQSRFEELLGG